MYERKKKSVIQAKTLGCDAILYAVWKSTIEYKALVRESLLPWYVSKGH